MKVVNTSAAHFGTRNCDLHGNVVASSWMAYNDAAMGAKNLCSFIKSLHL